MALFTTTYAPKNTSQVFGQQMAVSQLRDFVLNYKTQRQRAALLLGPMGCGKTATVYALAAELGYDLLEINSSDLRDEEGMKSFLGAALGQQSLFFTPKIILIDEIDNVSGKLDRGCIPAIVSLLEKARFPVILTANDVDDSKFKALVKISLTIEFHKLEYRTIAHALQWVCEQEGIKTEEKAINSLARQVDGDLRAALIDLQICSSDKRFLFERVTMLSERKRTDSILNALSIIFKSSSVDNALPVLDDLDVDMNDVFLWVDHNLPSEYKSAAALARAYESLSRADVFQSRIRRQQHWRFLVYVSNLLTAGVSSAKDERNPAFVPYKPTMRILRLWQAKMKHAKRKDIAAKLALKTHSSAKTAFSQVPYLRAVMKGSTAMKIAHELDLSDEEVEWLKS